jgi:hypothetical protein
MQKARRHTALNTARRDVVSLASAIRTLLSAVLRPLVGTRFQVLFHSRPRVLFTFPSRYCSTIGRQVVFSLRRWSSQIPTGFLVPHGTRVLGPGSLRLFTYRPFTFFGSAFQLLRLNRRFVSSRRGCTLVQPSPSTPLVQRMQTSPYSRFRLFPFRSPLLRESFLLSLPAGTKMFQFPAFASAFRRITGYYPSRVPPFGYLRVSAYLQLSGAFRSLSRPSSPPSA